MESMGVASGCDCKEVIDFLILLLPTLLVSALFIPTLCSFLKNVFLSCYIYNYIKE